jgi:hypothetical protein
VTHYDALAIIQRLDDLKWGVAFILMLCAAIAVGVLTPRGKL